jgi:chemotaxis response regulator CheB
MPDREMADCGSKVRVMIAGMPRMLSEIVRNIIISRDDLEFAGEAANVSALAQTAKELNVDVLVIGAAPDENNIACTDLLYARPRMRIVAIHGDGREAQFFQLRPHITRLVELSPDTLVAALRYRPESERLS